MYVYFLFFSFGLYQFSNPTTNNYNLMLKKKMQLLSTRYNKFQQSDTLRAIVVNWFSITTK